MATIRDYTQPRDISAFGRDLESLFVFMLDEALEHISEDKGPEEQIEEILAILDK